MSKEAVVLATVPAQIMINAATRGADIKIVVTMIRAGTTVIATTSEGMAGSKATGDGSVWFGRPCQTSQGSAVILWRDDRVLGVGGASAAIPKRTM